ncbi:PREDICTED: DNA-directed RNA polymerase II subunit RPB1-like [Priapulus caudatus]|uniref:DNA-directed RNA polymerase II subunit RPB1-like n=1 Tax=Priapulus caudatus TaxID=37621 RepID=A0ABM1DVV4_PRICU|nr:PREDICTED: DNA-directed RNA polymerase II subunit RPB1-like [Priapulus caudatus]
MKSYIIAIVVSVSLCIVEATNERPSYDYDRRSRQRANFARRHPQRFNDHQPSRSPYEYGRERHGREYPSPYGYNKERHGRQYPSAYGYNKERQGRQHPSPYGYGRERQGRQHPSPYGYGRESHVRQHPSKYDNRAEYDDNRHVSPPDNHHRPLRARQQRNNGYPARSPYYPAGTERPLSDSAHYSGRRPYADYADRARQLPPQNINYYGSGSQSDERRQQSVDQYYPPYRPRYANDENQTPSKQESHQPAVSRYASRSPYSTSSNQYTVAHDSYRPPVQPAHAQRVAYAPAPSQRDDAQPTISYNEHAYAKQYDASQQASQYGYNPNANYQQPPPGSSSYPPTTQHGYNPNANYQQPPPGSSSYPPITQYGHNANANYQQPPASSNSYPPTAQYTNANYQQPPASSNSYPSTAQYTNANYQQPPPSSSSYAPNTPIEQNSYDTNTNHQQSVGHDGSDRVHSGYQQQSPTTPQRSPQPASYYAPEYPPHSVSQPVNYASYSPPDAPQQGTISPQPVQYVAGQPHAHAQYNADNARGGRIDGGHLEDGDYRQGAHSGGTLHGDADHGGHAEEGGHGTYRKGAHEKGYDKVDVYINKRDGVRYGYRYGTEFFIPAPFPYVARPGEPDPVGVGLAGIVRADQVYQEGVAAAQANTLAY